MHLFCGAYVQGQPSYFYPIKFIENKNFFSLLHVVKTGTEVHPASYPKGIGGCFPGVKVAGAWSRLFSSS
jgi:hypothetical protein